MDFWLKIFGCLIPLVVIAVVVLDKEMGEIISLRNSNQEKEKR